MNNEIHFYIDVKEETIPDDILSDALINYADTKKAIENREDRQLTDEMAQGEMSMQFLGEEKQVEKETEIRVADAETVMRQEEDSQTTQQVVEDNNEIHKWGVERKMDTEERMAATDETAVITAGMKVHGDITSSGSLEVIGMIEGNIDVLGKLNITGAVNGDSRATEIFADGARITGEVCSDGSVKIGQSSVIIGNITATSAVIAGAVKGDIDVHGPVILDTSAIVMGNIKSKSVQINNGAVIEGMCSQCYAEVSPTNFFSEFKK